MTFRNPNSYLPLFEKYAIMSSNSASDSRRLSIIFS